MNATHQSRSGSRDSSDDGADDLDWARVLFLRGDFEQILMVRSGTHWDLPSFHYSGANSLRGGTCIDPLCRDVREWFDMDSSVHFAAVVELLGDKEMVVESCSPDNLTCANASVYVMQPQGIRTEDLVLPSGAEWKEAAFFSSWAEENGSLDIRQVAKSCTAYLSSRGAMKDPRFELGWYVSACEYLRLVALEDGATAQGNVEQVQLTWSSTVMKLNSSKGWYFAKASSVGNNEFMITARIAEIFPESSPIVLSTNTMLRCFVTREFEDVKPKESDVHLVIQKLADMQLESLSHIEELEQAGCPVRDLDALKEQLKVWTDYEFTKTEINGLKPFEMMTPVMMELCDKLKSYNIPNSLVHGDFARSNAAYANADRKHMILFDWEYACIGHPFFDFYRLYEDLSEKNRDEMVEEYLRRWSEFGNTERLKEAFKIGRCLGKWLSLWRLSESLESCEHQLRSELEMVCPCVTNCSLGVLLTENYFKWPE